MPQIAQLAETYSSQIFWLLVFFGIVFVFVGRGMVPKVMDTVAQRDQQISADLAAATAARAKADEEEEAWRVRENDNRAAAQAIVAQAKAEAADRNEKKLAAAQKRLDTKLAKAEQEISEARDAALAEVEGVAAEAAQDIVQRLAGVTVTAAAAKTAVKKALSHV
ncbi:F0F1 ATP synthase subunit B family protein [Allopontixanthobacter sediminis]|uniref:ATP synthase subunit b n=1 Tax=Allopontixanthobacter sediminis TaxID=1689985 RepID=A0A845AZM9_9SPHN|nr:ATPase [Allopontixanthobacter sediminis]MXP43386.1 ATPase [Allopontixanthobacter sediminis]